MKYAITALILGIAAIAITSVFITVWQTLFLVFYGVTVSIFIYNLIADAPKRVNVFNDQGRYVGYYISQAELPKPKNSRHLLTEQTKEHN